jgi:hypothetical protein
MTDQAHSPLGPSSADRWINCTGSVNATRGIADTSSEFAAEGSFAHNIAEMARKADKPAKHFIGHTDTQDGYEFVCDKEMADHVQFFIDYVNQFEADENLNEGRVKYDGWVEDGFGTLDAALLNDGTTIVADLKYGKGIQVYAEDNSQLKLYALGIFQEYGNLYDMQNFKLVIVQPRLGHIDEWEISLDELLVWAEEVVEPAAEEALTDTATFNAGSWCRWCKIRESCKTRYDHYKATLLDEIDEIRDPNELGNDELGELLDILPLIVSWTTDVKARGEKLVLAGEKIIGADGEPYKMVAGRNARKWRDADEAEKSMRNYKVKVSDMFVSKLVSPAQAEKLKALGKGHPMLKKHVVVAQGKPTLVPGSDKREAFKAAVDEMDDLDE